MSRLKAGLSELGLEFIGEMLDRKGALDNSLAEAVLSGGDALLLAEAFGIVDTTAALRLSHAFDLIRHIASTPDVPDPDAATAGDILRSCIEFLLVQEDRISADQFARFRGRVLTRSLAWADAQLTRLLKSPPFFLKTLFEGSPPAHRLCHRASDGQHFGDGDRAAMARLVTLFAAHRPVARTRHRSQRVLD